MEGQLSVFTWQPGEPCYRCISRLFGEQTLSVGYLTLLDFDTVSLSNLQRQILHRDETIGQPKVESARAQLAAINPHCIIETCDVQADDATLSALIAR
ncbi:hypothetical protein CRX72_12670 [Pantoea sp. BRM17]|nr:hypothetical protein CRX72_12670 [Pantoea sp. BRM17]